MTKARPLVSIIIPIYNAEAYLEECLGSVARQTYPRVEIIIINDGSTDNSRPIVDKLSAGDRRIVAIHRSNQGVSSARNLGIDKSSGEYVMFVDADDFLSADAVRRLVDSMGGRDSDIVVANMTEYHTNGYSMPVTLEHLINEKQPFKIKDISKHSTYELLTRINSPFNKLYRLKFLRDNDLKFPVDLRIAEDFNFVVKAYLLAKSIYFVNDWLYYYRQDFDNNHSATGNVDSSKSLDFGKSIKDIKDFIDKGGYGSRKLNAAFRMSVVDHSLYALDITEKSLSLNRDVFKYIHKDLMGHFNITEKDSDYAPHRTRLSYLLSGDYDGYLFSKMNELKKFSGEQTYAIDSLNKQLSEQELKISELSGRIEYMNSIKGMIRTPIGKAVRLAKRTLKKIVK